MLERRLANTPGFRREGEREATTHVLKCWTAFFTEIAEGRKRHDLRRATDRDFRAGDRLLLREFDPVRGCYTGREQKVVVTYITSADRPCALSEEALSPDFCILSIAHLTDA
ncbi:DUF3850 domain-containing protein [Novosphingobium sp. FSW06-99]|uniref:DUF3850 domain-containing protein n=1 Tax=Novosphingobium sp. FSW06-99 TaxID=1739113 RepID=UPI00076D0D8C|nr:DUF3850 domain-containing protein [Novosphingobium sp. FSW06-99]KUR78645.1 hypothetical protein AQZ49_07310 [Novosphingobium sp. FSW06-99]